VALIDTVREVSVGFSKQCHRRSLRFARNSATGTADILLINFISDVRRKRLFYLRKPNLQPPRGSRLSVARVRDNGHYLEAAEHQNNAARQHAKQHS
jgi:hypothetical protein